MFLKTLDTSHFLEVCSSYVPQSIEGEQIKSHAITCQTESSTLNQRWKLKKIRVHHQSFMNVLVLYIHMRFKIEDRGSIIAVDERSCVNLIKSLCGGTSWFDTHQTSNNEVPHQGLS